MWFQLQYRWIVTHQGEWDTRDLLEDSRGAYRELNPQRASKRVSTTSKASFRHCKALRKQGQISLYHQMLLSLDLMEFRVYMPAS